MILKITIQAILIITLIICINKCIRYNQDIHNDKEMNKSVGYLLLSFLITGLIAGGTISLFMADGKIFGDFLKSSILFGLLGLLLFMRIAVFASLCFMGEN
jgi:hypothetical protein